MENIIPVEVWHNVLDHQEILSKEDIIKLAKVCKTFYDILYSKLCFISPRQKIRIYGNSGIKITDGRIYTWGVNSNLRFLHNSYFVEKELDLPPVLQNVHLARLNREFLVLLNERGEMFLVGKYFPRGTIPFRTIDVTDKYHDVSYNINTHLFPNKKFKNMQLSNSNVLYAFDTENNVYYIDLGKKYYKRFSSERNVRSVFYNKDKYGFVDDLGFIYQTYNDNNNFETSFIDEVDTNVVWYYNNYNVWIVNDTDNNLWYYNILYNTKYLLYQDVVKAIVHSIKDNYIKIIWMTKVGIIYQCKIQKTPSCEQNNLFKISSPEIIYYQHEISDFDVLIDAYGNEWASNILIDMITKNGDQVQKLINV